MKKLVCLTMALLLVLCSAALADTVILEPAHTVSMDDFGTGDTTVKANFTPATAFDVQNSLIFLVRDNDLYARDDLLALKAGDRVVVSGQEDTVQSVAETENGIDVTTDNGIDSFFYVDEARTVLGAGEDDCSPYTTVIGECCYPMADQVTVRVWTLDSDGNQALDLTETTVPAAEVKGIFEARSDSGKDDYLNCEGSNHLTIRVQDGKVTEITLDWGSDD